MLKSSTLHSFLALSMCMTFSVVHLTPVGLKQTYCALDLPTQEQITEGFQDIFPSCLEKPRSLKLEDGYWVLEVRSPQDHISQDVPNSSTASVGQPNLLTNEGKEKVGELLNLSTNRDNLPDDLKRTHEMFRTVVMNTNNLYRFFSQKCFRKNESWHIYLGESLGMRRPSYKNFMQRITTFIGRKEEKSMSKFLMSVAHLHVQGFKSFSISRTVKFRRHKKAIITSLRSGCEGLKDKSLVYSNRLLVIGIIQYFKKYLPWNSESLADEFSHHTLDFQTALELFLTRDHEKAIESEIEAPFTNRHNSIPFDVRECFMRAAFMSQHEHSIKEGLLRDHPQGIHVLTLRYLLGNSFPRDVQTIKKFTSELGNLIAGDTLPEKETHYATALVSYLWSFPMYQNYIKEWLLVEQFFTTNFKLKAKEVIESFLKDKDNHFENGKKAYIITLDLLEDKISPSHNLIQTILDEMKSDSLDMSKKVELLHLLNAKAVIQPDLRAILLQKIYKHEEVCLYMAEVWSHIASQQPRLQTPLEDLDTIAFKLNPWLLTASYRKVLGARLQDKGNEDMKKIGQSLAKLPDHTQQEAHIKLQSLLENMESVLSTGGDAREYFGCLEVYLHLLWYNSTIATHILKSMLHKPIFNDNIFFFAERAIKNTQEASGIAKLQFLMFSEILKKFHWEIINLPPEVLESEDVGTRMITFWVQRLYSIRPV
ncbi:hypothetical protein DFH28DRAFT_31754 [Melampsora americana]|nr:hypothetical protein DFH28DRAFT_31754 [Melampsora americana]